MSANPQSELRIVDDFWAQLQAVDARRERRARAAEQRRRLARTLAIAVLALLLVAAVAVAAKLLFGSDAPKRFSPPESTRLGSIRPGTARMLAVREPDPGGGPPWGVRVFRVTARDQLCYQVGRVVGGRLVALGVAGDFGDDGLAHALPLEGNGCAGSTSGGHVAFVGSPEIVTTSALSASTGCAPPDRDRVVRGSIVVGRRKLAQAKARGDEAEARLLRRKLAASRRELSRLKPCPASTLRTVLVGALGPGAVEVTLEVGGAPVRRALRAPDQRAFLFVFRGRPPIAVGRLTVRYADGLRCPLGNIVGRVSTGPPPSAACIARIRR